MGTTTGMLIADGIGIVIGVVMCRKIPERTIKLVSAGVFILFGFLGTYQVAKNSLALSIGVIAGVLTILALITGIATFILIKNNKKAEEDMYLL